MTQDSGAEDSEIHTVVVDAQDRHSLWPLGRAVPAGWTATGFRGLRQDCLDHIADTWRDLRPRAQREADRERH